MSSSESPRKIILPEGFEDKATEQEKPADTLQPAEEDGGFPFRVKYVSPVEFKLVDFVTKEGNLQGPRRLVAFLVTGEAVVIVPDIQALPHLPPEEIKAIHEWEAMLQEKARLLGGNITIDPATGEVKAAPMPPGMSNMLGQMARGPGKRGG